MSAELSIVFQVIATFLAIVGAVAVHQRTVSAKMDKLHSRISELSEKVAATYVRRDDFSDFAKRIETGLDGIREILINRS